MVELKTFEQALKIQEKQLADKEKELKKRSEAINQKQLKTQRFNNSIQEECDWIEKEVKTQFCKEFVYEIIFEIESKVLEKEEDLVSQTKEIALISYEKLENSLKNFELLKKSFELEANPLLSFQNFKQKSLKPYLKSSSKSPFRPPPKHPNPPITNSSNPSTLFHKIPHTK
jgi:hypothetical protein